MSELSPSTQNPPLIVGFVANLMNAMRIEETAERLGYRMRWIERRSQLAAQPPSAASAAIDRGSSASPAGSASVAGQIAAPAAAVPAAQPPASAGADTISAASQPSHLAEALTGPEAILIERLAEWQPVLLIFDLGNSEVPWRAWIALLKSSPATRRIPVLCYGPHVDAEALQAARAAGAETVLPRSRFNADLAELIPQLARLPDTAAIATACQAPLSAEALHGLELFNAGEYFEAHEVLEAAWNADLTPGRELYRALLQTAVAYLQIERANYNGALKMFLRLRQWLAPLPDRCRGVDVARLRQDAFAAQAHLQALGPERIAEFDRRLFQPVSYQAPE